MATKSVWQESCELTDSLLELSSGKELPRGERIDYWAPFVAVSLTQANERLASAKLLLDNDAVESAAILVRSLFEIAVNLRYINKDIERRLTPYLKHGKIPLDQAEAIQMDEQLKNGGPQAVADMIPKSAWKSVREMCDDLGPAWSGELETYYRFSSIPVHSGAAFLANNYLRILKSRLPSAREKASHLLTGADLHSRIAAVAAGTFPEQIDLSQVNALRNRCGQIVSLYLLGSS